MIWTSVATDIISWIVLPTRAGVLQLARDRRELTTILNIDLNV